MKMYIIKRSSEGSLHGSYSAEQACVTCTEMGTRQVMMDDTLNRTGAEITAVKGEQTMRDDVSGVPGETRLSPSQETVAAYGDIPVAYAVFDVDIDAGAAKATDSRYVFVNEEYGRACSRGIERLIGVSHLEVGAIDKAEWLDKCYRVVANGETVQGFEYNQLVRDWISYTLAPSAVEGHCIYAFMVAAIDEQQHKQLMASADMRTTGFISVLLGTLSAEESYDAAMDGVLKMMSEVIQAERLMIFECGEQDTKVTFELLRDGGSSQLGTVYNLSSKVLEKWFEPSKGSSVVLVPDIAILERFSLPLFEWCQSSGITSVMAAPFYSDGGIVGFLGAYNYQLDEAIDLNMLFEAISSFIGARIENRRLIENLKWAGNHDVLTNLLNRRGSQMAIGELFAEHPRGPFALILVDLDDFKRTNDVFGHNAGDEALRSVAKTLVHELPDDAVISRNGGDEFLALLSGEDALQVDDLVESLSQKELSYEFEGVRHLVTMSIGYACYPEQADNRKELFSRADAALYSVKLAGKAGYEKFRDETNDRHRAQLGFSVRDIMDNVPYPIAVCRAGGEYDILFISNELAMMFGFDGMYDIMRSSGGALAGVMHPADRDRVFMTLAQRSHDNLDEDAPIGFRALTKAGDVKNVRVHARHVGIEGVGGVFYVLVDFVS